MIVEIRSSFFRPYTSDNRPANMLTKIPGTVDAAITYPINCISNSDVIKDSAKRGKIGLLDIVELKIAKNPIKLIIKKYSTFRFKLSLFNFNDS